MVQVPEFVSPISLFLDLRGGWSFSTTFFALIVFFFFFFFSFSLSVFVTAFNAQITHGSLAFLACVCFCKRTDLLNTVTVQADALNNNVRKISNQHTHLHTGVKESVKRQATVWQEQ